MEKKETRMLNSTPLAICFFFIHLLLPWKQTLELLRSRLTWIHHRWFWKWDYLFSWHLLGFFVRLVLICFVYYNLFVCFLHCTKTNSVLAQNEFCNKGQQTGKVTLVCWASVYKTHCLRGIEASTIHCNIFSIFTLCSRIISLLLYSEAPARAKRA